MKTHVVEPSCKFLALHQRQVRGVLSWGPDPADLDSWLVIDDVDVGISCSSGSARRLRGEDCCRRFVLLCGVVAGLVRASASSVNMGDIQWLDIEGRDSAEKRAPLIYRRALVRALIHRCIQYTE